MKRRLAPDDARLYQLCDEALFYLWDPIGIAEDPRARSEYEAYVPQVFQLVKARRREGLLTYLREVAEEWMGLSPPFSSASETTADFLIEAAKSVSDISESSATSRDVQRN